MDLLVFPNQLYQMHPGLASKPERVVLMEDSLFFGDDRYPARFHKQKLWLHRATMKRYAHWLAGKEIEVWYVEYEPGRRLGETLRQLQSDGLATEISIVEPTDFILHQRLRQSILELGLACQWLPDPGFLNDKDQNQDYRAGKKRWFMADFYKWQRRRLNLLVDDEGNPDGGKWSFDGENRKKIPRKLLGEIPALPELRRDKFDTDAVGYVQKRFPDHPGSLDRLFYPSSHGVAKRWLGEFLKHRFERFGDYEDAIQQGESWLWHSVLTPSLNLGLLTPEQVMSEVMKHAGKEAIPLNSLEGFVRQVIGWREFMRATYDDLGVPMRTTNHWHHHRPMPSAFYDGSTGVEPVDDVIHRILETGYCHHIERLMVLGGFMFLCEIDPNDIYLWFMELFVDSYDWVMVPNVYAMSQNADGGLITTKPYFSGSSYIKKMSHYGKGEWCDIWDGLYWRWIWNHADELSKNPRWAMMCSVAKKMDSAKMQGHVDTAEAFLNQLA